MGGGGFSYVVKAPFEGQKNGSYRKTFSSNETRIYKYTYSAPLKKYEIY